MTASDHARVSVEVFDQLRELEAARPGTLATVARHYLSAGAAHLETLASAGVDRIAEVVTAAHSLKGSSGMIGASEVARLAAIVEDQARAGAVSPDHAAQLRAAFEAFVPCLQSLLDEVSNPSTGR